jgi:septum site-determining protein MinC
MANPASGVPRALEPSDDSVVEGAARPPFTVRNAGNGALILGLLPGASFDALRAALRANFSGDRFRGATMRLDIGARDVDLFELRRLIHLLKGEFGVDVVGMHCTNEALLRFAEREFKLKVHLQAPEPEAPAPPPPPTVQEEAATELVAAPPPEDEDEPANIGRSVTVDGTVRSGAVIRSPGDVTVFGDVNPGAQIIAAGNVIVLGALKGLAHAGYRGDDRAVIVAFDMRPTQLRIGKVIQLPRLANPEREARHAVPEVAWIHDGNIQIEPYRGRLPGVGHTTKENP